MRFAYLGASVLGVSVLAAVAGCPASNPAGLPPAEPELASPVIDEPLDLARGLLALPTSTVPVVLPPNPGPMAARGQVLVNGVPKAGIAMQIQKTTGGTITCVTDAQGYFTARNLAPGNYLGYYYNASDRNKIGYWRGVAKPVTSLTGASFPAIDLYQVGMTNLPKMDSHVGLPTSFSWVLQAQKTDHLWFRIHDRPFTAFTLTYRSAMLPGTTNSFTFTGGMPLKKTNRYFWGFQWDAGPVGMGGNLYQAVYFDR